MIISPLRYPGGKAKLSSYVSRIVEQNKLFSSSYCEPYAGGAGLAIKLLTEGFVKNARFNDIDPAIMAFWNAVFFETDDLCELIHRCELSVSEWRRQKETYQENDKPSLQIGFATYYLNRTSRSGIIEGSGPIGGYEQAGSWKIDARFNRERQIENIRLLATFRDRIELTQKDALEFMNDHIDNVTNFLYLDPPYYVKGKKLYKNFYRHEDHVRIHARLSQSPRGNWIISYDDVEEIRSIYRPKLPISYNLSYSAGPVGTGSEVMFSSDTIELPQFNLAKAA